MQVRHHLRNFSKIKDEESAIWVNGLQKIQNECERQHYEIMKSYIIAGEFNINEPLPNNGNSALGESYIYNDFDYARKLIDNGAWYIEYDAFRTTYEGWHGGEYYKEGKPIWKEELCYSKLGANHLYKKVEVENKQKIASYKEIELNLYTGKKTYDIFGKKVITRKTIPEWTQNMNVLKFVLSELNADYFHKLISNLRSHYSSFPCEDEISLMELKYYIFKNDFMQLIAFLNSCPKYKKMIVIYGLPVTNDNEYVELYFNSSFDFKKNLNDWREKEKDNVTSTEQLPWLINNFVPTSNFDIPIHIVITYLFLNKIDSLKQILNCIKLNNPVLHKELVLAQRFDGLNALVDGYFRSNLETKMFFDHWRFEGSKQYLKEATLMPLFYRDQYNNILTQRDKNNKYEVSWHFGIDKT